MFSEKLNTLLVILELTITAHWQSAKSLKKINTFGQEPLLCYVCIADRPVGGTITSARCVAGMKWVHTVVNKYTDLRKHCLNNLSALIIISFYNHGVCIISNIDHTVDLGNIINYV